jgi:hypothetical protein
MGAPDFQYEEQHIEVQTPEIHVVATGDDPLLLWTAGVIVPLVLGILGFWFRHKHKDLKGEGK